MRLAECHRRRNLPEGKLSAERIAGLNGSCAGENWHNSLKVNGAMVLALGGMGAANLKVEN